MQEEHTAGGNEQGCLLIHEDGKWWICIPGFGQKPTEWLVEGRLQPNKDPMDMEQIEWFAPYWKRDAPTKAVCCQQGALWLYDRLQAEKDASVHDYNEISQQWHDRDVLQASNPSASSAGDAGDVHFEVEPDDADTADATVELSSDEEDEQEQEEEWGYKPKAGSLNHKVALIGAVERKEWGRLHHLCKVFLTFASHLFSFKLVVQQPNLTLHINPNPSSNHKLILNPTPKPKSKVQAKPRGQEVCGQPPQSC